MEEMGQVERVCGRTCITMLDKEKKGLMVSYDEREAAGWGGQQSGV